MGKTWQSDDHKAFFDEYSTLYDSKHDEGKLKEFWPVVIEEWFKRWPLSDPPEELVAKEGVVEKACKVWKARKIEVSII